MTENPSSTFRLRRWDPHTAAVTTQTCPLVRSTDQQVRPVMLGNEPDTWTLGYATSWTPIGQSHNPFCKPTDHDGLVTLRCGVSVTPDKLILSQPHPAKDCFCGDTTRARFPIGNPPEPDQADQDRNNRHDRPVADITITATFPNRPSAPYALCDYPPDLYDARTWRDGVVPPATVSTSKKSLYDAAAYRVVYTEGQLRSARFLRDLYTSPHLQDYAACMNASWGAVDLKRTGVSYYAASGASPGKAKILIGESMCTYWQASWRDDTVLAASTTHERITCLRLADIEYGASVDGAFDGDLTTEFDNSPILSEVNCAAGIHSASTEFAVQHAADIQPSRVAMSFPVAMEWRNANGYMAIYTRDRITYRVDYGCCRCFDAWLTAASANDIEDFPTDIQIRGPFNIFAIGLAVTGHDLRQTYARHYPAILRNALTCGCGSPGARWMLTALVFYTIAPRYLGLARLARICQTYSQPTPEAFQSLRHHGMNVIAPDWTINSSPAPDPPMQDFLTSLNMLFKADLDAANVDPNNRTDCAQALTSLGRDSAEKNLIQTVVMAYATVYDQALAGGDVETIVGDSIRLHDTLAQGRLTRVTAALAAMTVCYRGGFYPTFASLTTLTLG